MGPREGAPASLPRPLRPTGPQPHAKGARKARNGHRVRGPQPAGPAFATSTALADQLVCSLAWPVPSSWGRCPPTCAGTRRARRTVLWETQVETRKGVTALSVSETISTSACRAKGVALPAARPHPFNATIARARCCASLEASSPLEFGGPGWLASPMREPRCGCGVQGRRHAGRRPPGSLVVVSTCHGAITGPASARLPLPFTLSRRTKFHPGNRTRAFRKCSLARGGDYQGRATCGRRCRRLLWPSTTTHTWLAFGKPA